MSEREVVVCSHDRACGWLGPDHHGWGCPLSDPMGDVLRAATDGPANPNPILERSRRAMLDRWWAREEKT